MCGYTVIFNHASVCPIRLKVGYCCCVCSNTDKKAAKPVLQEVYFLVGKVTIMRDNKLILVDALLKNEATI